MFFNMTIHFWIKYDLDAQTPYQDIDGISPPRQLEAHGLKL